MVYSALFGGSGDEVGNALALGNDGTVYLGGTTSSVDFGLRQRKVSSSTGDDAFICRVHAATNTARCVSFGGSKPEKLTGLALDGRAGIYAVGATTSADFPSKRPVQKGLRGPTDMFLTRIAIPSLKMTFSTMFGGSGDDSGWGLATDARGNPIVTGITDSEDLAGTQDSYQPQKRGMKDAFVAAFTGANHGGIRVTYFGGPSDDESGYDGGNVKVDRHGNVWFVGITRSDDLPMRNATHNQYGGGDGDGFIAGLNPELKRLCFATYVGDKDRNLLEGVAISASDSIAATGVSFRNSPSASTVQLGPTLYAGHNAVLLRGHTNCDK